MNLINKGDKIVQIGNTTPLTPVIPALAAYNMDATAAAQLQEICCKGLLKVLLTIDLAEVIPTHHALLQEGIRYLEEGGYIRMENNRIQPLKEVHDFDINHSLSVLDAAYARLLQVSLSALGNILTGKVRATDVLFPGGSLDYVMDIYKGNYQSDYFNNSLAAIVAATVAKAIPHLKDGEKIRILEVGAGTGGTSAAIFQQLQPYAPHLEYCYTDISRRFLLHATDTYGQMVPYLSTAIFNAELSPASQQFVAGTFDMVIAANVLHATKDISVTLNNIKYLLKKEGLLLLNEIATTEIFSTLTFGLLDGWWLHEDKELRLDGSPGLSFDNWELALNEGGFESVQAYPENTQLPQQIIIAAGNGQIVMPNDKATTPQTKKTVIKETTAASDLRQTIKTYLKSVFSEVLKLDMNQIDEQDSFESFGADSIMIGSLSKEFSDKFGEVPATVFFEYNNIHELSAYFEEHFAAHFQPAVKPVQTVVAAPKIISEKAAVTPTQDVAIIGISGRYPGANNINELWENLKSGTDSITEIPAARWPKSKSSKISSPYGGFLDGIADFDPIFFNIAPKDAAMIDPQERLFLQTAWEAVEDAGYKASDLSQRSTFPTPVKTGVYVGVMYEEYQFYAAAVSGASTAHVLGGSPSSIANRVSYFCDFNGPSLAIDTMCSSSLTAIHLACKDLRDGDTDYAIAGGVNVSVHPNKYLLLSEAAFLSSKGRCESFAEGGDGFIPGEGTGAVLLKLLDKAVADGDHIYGVIKGSAVNHGGRTNGYTVPSPRAQAAVIKEALQHAKVAPHEFSYIEAHGTGTDLGDPIEIAGLNKVFDTEEKQYCHIGSVKSNIGHCESAAGIAGVTKVLLQLQHQQIVPSLHSTRLNPKINFADSAFAVPQQLQEWHTKNNRLRLAGISSFGAGGSNAHIVLEEYRALHQTPYQQASPAIIVLSAKNADRLKAQAEKLLHFLKDQNIYDLAWTLQTGREAMEERLAFSAVSIEEIKEKLTSYLRNTTTHIFTGNIRKDKIDFLLEGAAGKAYMAEAMAHKEIKALAGLWVKGVSIDWSLLYEGHTPARISLPTYAFEKRYCWFSPVVQQEVHPNNAAAFYAHATEQASGEFQEEYLTFCPFEEKIPGFSMTRLFLHADKYPKEREMVKELQLQMREVLFEGIDFNKVRNVFDIGCGHGTDLIRLANRYPHLQAKGFSITHSQIELATSRIRQQQLENRVAVYHKDSAVDAIPGQNDLVIGIEVSFHIRDKNALFTNITQSLKENGDVLLIDYISNLRGRIVDENVEVTIPTQQEWINILAAHELVITEIIDVSPGIANFLYDPEADTYLKDVPAITRDTFKNYANQYTSLSKGWISYCLFKLKKRTDLSAPEREQLNTQRIANKKPYFQRTAETLFFTSEWKKSAGTIKEEITFAEQLVVLYEYPGMDITALRNEMKDTEFMIIREDFIHESVRVYEHIRRLCKQTTTSPVLVQAIIPKGNKYAGLSGLFKTAKQENPRLHVQIIQHEGNLSVADLIRENRALSSDIEISYSNQERYILSETLLQPIATNPKVWRQDGIYLITGGLGELGYTFAAEIVKQAPGAKLILTGRSALTPEKQQKVQAVNGTYFSLDIGNRGAVDQLVKDIQQQYGSLHGVIHSAGIIKDNFIINKHADEFETVLWPKVAGTIHLDEATSQLDLDCFILFSSIAGRTGNIGQADYATANSFMDVYAAHRSQHRTGKTLSINWPFWADGGMHIDNAMQTKLKQGLGMEALNHKQGIAAFYQAYGAGHPQVMVLNGDRAKLLKQAAPRQIVKTIVRTGGAVSKEQVLQRLSDVLQNVLKLEVQDLSNVSNFMELGVDSVNVVELVEAINQEFMLEMPTSILFSFGTLDLLAEYIASQAPQVKEEVISSPIASFQETTSLNTSFQESTSLNTSFQETTSLNTSFQETTSLNTSFQESTSSIPFSQETSSPLNAAAPIAFPPTALNTDPDIAIIGIACKSAGADTPDEFWQMIKAGKDSIADITDPDWRQFLNAHTTDADKIRYGALKNSTAFDAAFFNISPREAKVMDATQRVLLEECYKVMEDAGYAPSSLAGKPVGTFIGAMGTVPVNNDLSHYSMLGNENSILAGRVAHYFNFKGPAFTLNTACSSSLVAIDLAAQQLKSGTIDLAIGGGITIYTHPSVFISMKNAGMLSPEGECRPFDNNANGIVVGDGVGVVLLKRMEDAKRDGDHIYGVIRGSGVNQNGRTLSITVPSHFAQSELIESVYRKNNIDVENISYIETHGTATKLGDPAEIQGLTQAISKFTNKKGFCAIGSLKANIGHTTAAAGVLSLIKVLQGFKHQQLPPSIHYTTSNEHINFADSPVVVNQSLQHWALNNKGTRLAGVSSFGFSGTNAHMVLESYEHAQSHVHALSSPALIVLSARNEERLMDQVIQLKNYLQQHPHLSLPDIAYTLQTGRDTMDARLALVCEHTQHLITQLDAITKGTAQNIYSGNTRKGKETNTTIGHDLAAHAAAWVKGGIVNWASLYNGSIPQKISLPAYAFAKEQYPLDINILPAQERKEEIATLQLINLDADTQPLVISETEPVITLQQEVITGALTYEEVITRLKQVFEEILHIPAKDVDEETSFIELGLDSISGIEILREVNNIYGVVIQGALLYENPTLKELAGMILKAPVSASAHTTISSQNLHTTIPQNAPHTILPPEEPLNPHPPIDPPPSADDIAIIGIDGIFPGADAPESLWQQAISSSRLKLHSSNHGYHTIDESIFNKNQEDQSSDARQHTLIFGLLDRILNDADINITNTNTGVFLGIAQHMDQVTISKSDTLASMIPAKLAFKYNLTGPCEIVNAACTSSFLALHKAIQNIRLGDCNQAIVGGVNVITKETANYGGIPDLVGLLSPDHEMKSFDQGADGIVRSEGAGLMIVKPLHKAMADGNKIYAVIKGSSYLHGGKNISWEAPNPRGIKAAIRKTVAQAGVPVDTIDYLEAHGIANKISDAIELGALNGVYRELSTNPEKKWWISSVKPIVGHPGIASGMAAIIKVVKAFQHKQLPGIPGLRNVNNELDPTHAMLLSATATHWHNGTYPRRAGLNSFAVGGTSAHLILEEYKGAVKEKLHPAISLTATSQQDESFNRFTTILADTLELTVTPEMMELSLQDLNVNSVKVMGFAKALNDSYGVRLTLGQLLMADTLTDLTRLLSNTTPVINNDLIPLSTSGEGMTYIIPGMPGIVDGYFELAEALPTKVYGLQMKGISDNSTPAVSVQEMAAHNIQLIRQHSGNTPVQLVAHSYGGIVLFEMLKQMRDIPVTAISLTDSPVTSIPVTSIPVTNIPVTNIPVTSIPVTNIVLIDSYSQTYIVPVQERIRMFIQSSLQMLRLPVPPEAERTALHAALYDGAERAAMIMDFLRQAGVPDTNGDMMTRVWQVFEASLDLDYALTGSLDIPAVLIRAEGEILSGAQPDLGWRNYLSNLKVINAAGDHFAITRAPYCSQWISQQN